MSTHLPDVLAKLRQEGPLRDAIEQLKKVVDFYGTSGDDPPPHVEQVKLVLLFINEVSCAQTLDGRLHRKLLRASKLVLAGLLARIEAAPSTAKPLFNGIAELHAAIKKIEARK